MGEHRWALIGLLLCQVGQISASLLLPAMSANVINEGIAPEAPDVILRYGGLMGLAALTQLVFSVTAVALGARIAFGIGRDLRADVFRKVHSLAVSQVQDFGIGALITRCTNDVLQVQTMLVMVLTMIIVAPIMGVGAAAMAVRQDVALSAVLLVAVPVLALIIGFLTLRATPLYRRMQEQLDRVNSILRERLEGIRVIRAFLQQSRESKRFGQANDDLTETSIRAGRLMAMTMPSVSAVMQLTSVALIWVAADRVHAGDLEVGALIAFLAYIALILVSVMMTGMLIVMLPRALVSAGRIKTLLRSAALVGPPAVAQPLPPKGSWLVLRFEDVTFGYAEADSMVLQDINFEVGPSEVLGVIGATGSGKSTIVNLTARLNDPTTGRVTLGDVDLRAIAPESLAGRIGYVPQKSYLFSGTVAETLRLGNPDADDAAIWHALEVAQAADFIRALPEGLEAPVAQGGTNFSGGQRQRLAIARALLCEADLYLFDDSFSALDQATDARVRAALRSETRRAATLIVGQRVTSIRDADRILVIVRSQQGTAEDAA
ncbi:ABC transporter ATP-binding protein [Pseudophaeobacter sp.]|uniref:ABC transporter ATP-binding protein n=1 Tax=Pseudophaeobacter sp. TaxID=1971739 RepID=UPI0032969D1D